MKASPVADTYSDVEGIIYSTVTSFHRKHGGDYQEMVCVANMVFMDVYAKFDPAKGCITTLLVNSIYRRLIDHMVIGGRRSKRTSSLDIADEVTGKTKAEAVPARSSLDFDMLAFIQMLSDDASTVLKLVLETPSEIESVVFTKGSTPGSWRSTIRQYLKKLGWKSDRIANSFMEIGEVLQS